MAMLRISMSIEGDLVIDRILEGIEERAKDLSPVWPQVVTIFRAMAKRAFDTEGASTGAPWQELAESTQRDRASHGFPPAHPILQRTTKLMRSLTIGDSGGFVESDKTGLAIGTEVEYFKYHQSNKPRFKIPRRAPILLTADDKHELVRPIRLYLTGRDPGAAQRARVG